MGDVSAEAGAVLGFDFDEVLEAVGDEGFYQIFIFALIGFMQFAAIDAFAINFLAGKMEHWCHVDAARDSILANLSDVDARRLTVPASSESASGFERCFRYAANFSELATSNWSSDVMLESAWKANESSVWRDAPVVPCDAGWNYDHSIFHSTIVSQWDLVCDRAWLVDLVSTVYMIGRLIACIIIGPITDRFGRKMPVVVFHGVKMVGCVLSIYAPTYEVFAFSRFVIAVGSTASNLATFLIVSEVSGKKWRSIFGIGWSMMLTFGSVLLPGVAYFIRDYQTLQAVYTWPQFVIFAYIFVLDESPRWLASRGRNKDAMKILRKIAKFNRRHLAEEITLTNIQQVPQDVKSSTPSRPASHHCGCCTRSGCSDCAVRSLVATPNLRAKSLIIWLNWFIDALMYYALSLNVGRLPGDIFLNMFLLSVVEIPANIAAVFLLEKLGRRPTVGGSTVCGAVASILMIPFMFIGNTEVAVTVFAVLGKMFITCAYSSVYVVTADTYPTNIRAIGMGTAASIGRLGSIGASFVGGILTETWRPIPSVLFGSLGLLSGGLIFLLPETRNQKLPASIEEAENFGKKRRRHRSLSIHEPIPAEVIELHVGVSSSPSASLNPADLLLNKQTRTPPTANGNGHVAVG